MPARHAIFLDANAGAPLRASVIDAILPLIGNRERLLPNPSSIHSHGRTAKRLLAEARESIATTLGKNIDSEQIVFTSSGSESNQLAVRGVLEKLLESGKKPHWITTPIEHDSTLQLVQWFTARGGAVDFLPVHSDGLIDFSALERLWTKDTALVSAVWVNNETGVIFDAQKLYQEVKRLGGLLHIDAAQAWGKLELDVEKLGDFVTFSGHKVGALAGVGFLWVGGRTGVHALIKGKQEKGRRGGTENLLGIVSMGAAAKTLEPLAWQARVAPLRDRLENAICSQIPGTRINGGKSLRVANTVNLSFEGIEGDGLVMALDLAGYSVAAGSACSSGALEPSHVLLAMGVPKAEALSAVRISLADQMAWEGDLGLESFVTALAQIVTRARNASPSK